MGTEESQPDALGGQVSVKCHDRGSVIGSDRADVGRGPVFEQDVHVSSGLVRHRHHLVREAGGHGRGARERVPSCEILAHYEPIEDVRARRRVLSGQALRLLVRSLGRWSGSGKEE